MLTDSFDVSEDYIKITKHSRGGLEPSSARNSTDKTYKKYRYD